MAKIYVGAKKVKISIKTGIDLTNATVRKFYVKKPDGREVEWTALIESPATNGILYYITSATVNELDVDGNWLIQSYVELSSGFKALGETATFPIYKRWK